jgi:Exoribonuclease Xrn1 D2/D3 domain
MIGISNLALSRITSSFMVITSDGQKSNLGLSLKFEAKSMKVLDYSQKSPNGKGWEYSEKAIQLIRDYKVCLRIDFLFLTSLTFLSE